MTDRKFLKRMIALTRRMSDLYNDEPFNESARLAILEEVSDIGRRFDRSRRYRYLVPASIILFLLCCLFWLIVTILF